MDSQPNYHLICDHCSHCEYALHAFTLLRLPLTTSKDNFDHIQTSKNCVLLICPQIENSDSRLTERALESNLKVITFNANTNSTHPNLLKLNPFFSILDLKIALSKCATKNNANIENNFELNHPIFERLIGKSEAIAKIKMLIHQVAQSDATVLILGESGTGKDVVASCIHYLSNRKNKSYVPINCGAIPGELIESELFGHEKGAFTGAHAKRQGRFELAQHGTLFLDEIGDMPLNMQVKLLRVLQDRKFERVGGNTQIDTDVRIIAATNKNLEQLIKNAQFREDLYHRINVFPIQMPNLSQRANDIADLINYHLIRIQKRTNHIVHFTEAAIDVLSHYQWPGNIRELENFLERMVITHHERVIDHTELDKRYKQRSFNLPSEFNSDEESFNMQEYLAKVEKEAIEYALAKYNGMIHSAANYLSIGTKKLTEKIKEYNLYFE